MLAELYTYQAIFLHFIPAHIMVISRFLGNTKDTIGSLKNFHFKWRLFNALKKIYIYIYIESPYKFTKFHVTLLFIQAHIAFKSGIFSNWKPIQKLQNFMQVILTAWKASVFRVFSGPHFPTFCSVRMRETDQRNWTLFRQWSYYGCKKAVYSPLRLHF